MLACRACRVPLSAIAGCALCDPVRQNLVVVGESEEERPSLPDLGADMVRLLRDQMKRLKDLLKDDPDDPASVSRLLAAGNTAAKVIGEVRKLQDDGKKAIEAMSFVERAELFIDWVTALPPAYRQSLIERLQQWEKQNAQPVPHVATLRGESDTAPAMPASGSGGGTTSAKSPAEAMSATPKPGVPDKGGNAN